MPQTARWMYQNTKHILWKIMILTLCAVAISYISVKFALVSKTLLDEATKQGGDIIKPIIAMIVLVVVQLLVQIVYTILNLHTETTYKNGLQRRVFSKLLRKKWQDITTHHSGEVLNRLNGDINIITSGVMSILPNIFSFVSRIVMGFYALYILDKYFALVFLVIGPFVMLVSKLYSNTVKPLHKKCQKSLGGIHSFILETIQNILVVKSFSSYSQVDKKIGDLQNEYKRVIMKRGYISIVANILFFVSLTIGYYFAIGWCAVKISKGIMTIGTFTAIIQLVGQVQTPFKELATTIPQIFAISASAERVMEFENLEDEKHQYNIEDFESVYDSMESISFDNIFFTYGDEIIFEDASLVIPKGSITSVSGISGIGKSTLLKLILGVLEPDEGKVYLKCRDNEYNLDSSLRPLFAYVPQGNMILSGTVRENICFMSSEVDEEKIIEASKLACIYNVVKEMPDGFDTVLGEGGFGLSEGQLQRLAIARAFYSGASVILLDEATSALDEETEKELLENIRSLQNCTCVIISHKEASKEICDISVAIQDKKLVSKKNNVD